MLTEQQRQQVRKWLRGYRFIEKELNARVKHYEDYVKNIYNPLKATSLNGVCVSSGAVSDPTYEAVVRIIDRFENILQSMMTTIELLSDKLTIIDTALGCLTDTERCVIHHRCIMDISWYDLPAYLNYEQAQCKRIEVSALDKLYIFMPK